MKITEIKIKQIIREEIANVKKEQQLNEALSKEDYEMIKNLIRAEVAAIMFDLFKKRSVWV